MACSVSVGPNDLCVVVQDLELKHNVLRSVHKGTTEKDLSSISQNSRPTSASLASCLHNVQGLVLKSTELHQRGFTMLRARNCGSTCSTMQVSAGHQDLLSVELTCSGQHRSSFFWNVSGFWDPPGMGNVSVVSLQIEHIDGTRNRGQPGSDKLLT